MALLKNAAKCVMRRTMVHGIMQKRNKTRNENNKGAWHYAKTRQNA